MLTTYILFGVSFVIILVACELFSNGVEWFGFRLGLGESAVGSILAAIGTALPETIIPIFAILFGAGEAGENIGIGAIIGSSFMLATLTMFVVGVGISVFSLTRGRTLDVDAHIKSISRDLRYFLLSYSIALLAATLSLRPLKIALAIVLLGIYAQYFRSTIANGGEAGSELKPLHFHRKGLPPRWRFIALQIVISLAFILYGSHLFIDQVVRISDHFAMSALVLSLLITPIATELPEKFNSILWVRNNKDVLAIGNVTGAMVFQSCILPAFGIFFTPWHLTEPAIVAASLGLVSSILILAILMLRKRLHAVNLILGGVFYIGFILYVFMLGKLGAGFATKALIGIFKS